jgi:hypothetical protein
MMNSDDTDDTFVVSFKFEDQAVRMLDAIYVRGHGLAVSLRRTPLNSPWKLDSTAVINPTD